MSRLDNKSIIVTGGASGIGAACATLFAREGANVLLCDIDTQTGAAMAENLGESVVFNKLDVRNEDHWKRAVASAVERFGRVDGIGNIAGIDLYNDNLEDCTPATWNTILRVNLDGVFLGTKHGIGTMKETGGGSIVNISSIFALVSDPHGHNIAYTTSKGGVRLLSKSAAMHCGKEGYAIRVNSIHPGFIQTPMVTVDIDRADDPEAERDAITARHPIGRLGRPEEIAYTALYLLSEESAFVTGAELAVDGGYTAV